MIGATICNIITMLVMAWLSVYFGKWWIVLFSLLMLWLPDITYINPGNGDDNEQDS